ncbi:MAG TPA: thiamine pyrophosphate-binding protein [Steroidobacteraceae bacterium]
MSEFEQDAAGPDVKALIRQFIDRGLSRRRFLRGLAGLGVSAQTARALAGDFAPFADQPLADGTPKPLPAWARTVTGTGGKLLVEQLKASQCKYIFTTPSSGEATIFDSLVDDTDMQLIQVLHEGSLAAAADGYGRASRQTPFVLLARPGLPNAMGQMYNAWKDFTPMVVMVDDVGVAILGQDGFEAVEHMSSMTAPIVKWHWSIEASYKIPETVRRALKFAGTKPHRPVFLACPEDLLSGQDTATVIDQQKYAVSTELRPSAQAAAAIAQLLASARNPLIYAGDDVRYCDAEPQLLELANLLSIPVVNDSSGWSRNFPTEHPLFAGRFELNARYPGDVDVLLHLGSRFQVGTGRTIHLDSTTKLIQIGLDSTSLARNFPTEVAVTADVRLALIDVIAELRRIGPSGWGDVQQRLQRARAFQADRAAMLESIRRQQWDNAPLSESRLLAELDAGIPRNANIVSDGDTFRPLLEYGLRFGPDGRDLYATTGGSLGWGLPAAFGVQLAQPGRAVVALVSDGSFLFSGPQVLWTYARYHAPITVLVLNNRSYNGERNRILMNRGRAYQTGRDMVCYLGNPDIDFAKVAAGFGVAGEVVQAPNELRPALARARAMNESGKPYLLDVHMERTGSLANSTWHPPFRLSDLEGGQRS